MVSVMSDSYCLACNLTHGMGQKCAGLLVAVVGCLCWMVFLEEYLRKKTEKARFKVSCGQSEDQPKRSAASTVAARSHTEPQGGEQGCG